MNYRMFYTLHAFCGFFVFLQFIFRITWLPFHLLATLLAILIIFRFRKCRWARFEFCLALIILYLFRVTLLFVMMNVIWLWNIYYLFLLLIGLGFLAISLRLFFC